MSETEEADEEYSTLTVVQLRELCKERGLKVGGVKNEIIDRLIESDNDFSNNDHDDAVVVEEATTTAASAMASPVNNNVPANESNDGVDECAADDNNDSGGTNIQNNDDYKSPTARDESEAAASSTLLSAPALPRSGVAEDAELLAELRAISNKSSSGRFQDEDDTNIAEEVQLDENCLNGNDVAAHDSNNLPDDENDAVVTDTDGNGGEEFDDDDFDDDAFLPNATIDVEDEDQFVLDNDIDVHDNFSGDMVEANDTGGEQEQPDTAVEMPFEVTDVEQPEDSNSNNTVSNGQLQANESDQEEMNSPKDDDTADQSSKSSFEDIYNDNEDDVAADDEEEVNESVYHDADDNIVQNDEVTDPPAEENVGIKSSLTNTFNGKNGGIAEDADLLAELRAISNKASGGRFDDGEDVVDTKSAAAVKDTENDAASSPPVEEKAKALPPWKQKNKSKKNSSTAFDVDIVVASAPAPAPIDPFENAMCDEKNTETTSPPLSDHPVVEEHFGIKSSLPNTFNGKNGGVAEDADLLAELRAISNKASGDRFDGSEESSPKEANEEVVTSVAEEKPSDAVALSSVGEKKSNAQSSSSKPLPPWKQKRAATKKQLPNSFDVDIVVAAAPTPTAIVKENDIEPTVTVHEQQQDNEPPSENNFGIKSSLPNTFNGKNGGTAEDADLLAELRAISNKTSGSRFDGGEDDDNAQPASREVQSAEVAVVKETVALPPVEEKKKSEADKLSRPLPPWKRKNAKAKTSPAVDVDIVVAAAPAPAMADPFQNAFVHGEISEPEQAREEKPQLPTEDSIGIKSSLPNTFNGKNGGIAEDADLLAELRAISNKASGNRFDGEEEDDNAQSSVNDEMNNATAATVKDTSIDAVPPPTVAKKSDASRPLPPWKRKGAAAKKKTSSTAFDVDVVVAAAPAPAAIDKSQNPAPCNQVDEPSPCVKDEPPTEVMMGIKSSLPNTFNGKNGGTAEDADLLAELRAISNKTSVNRFDVGDDDNNAQSSSNNEAGCTMTTKESNEKKSDVRHSSKPLPPWKQKRASPKKPSSADFNVDVVVAASPAPVVADPFENAMGDESFTTAADEKEIDGSNDADDDIVEEKAIELSATENMGIKSGLPNTFNGKNGGIAEDADLLAELRAISNKTSSSRFVGGGEDDNIQSSTTAIPPVTKEEKNQAGNTVPPWKQKNSVKKDTSAAAFEVDIVVAAPAPAAIDSSENDSSNDNFRDNGNENVENSSKSKAFAVDDKPWKKKSKDKSSGSLPPWKVKREKKNPVDKSHSESVPDPFQNALVEEANPSNAQSSLSSSDMVEHATKNTFSGKNGGAAEDADLLAELQAISSKSSNRFVDTDAPTSESTKEVKNVEPSSSLPPWKKKAPLKKAKNVEIDVEVSAPPNREPKEENMGIKSSLPATFKGKNGGTAEDADLLAELRAISMKTSSNRFSDGDDEEIEVSASDAPSKPDLSLAKPWQKNKPSKKDDSRPLPPWKQKGAKQNAAALDETNITVAAPSVQSINATVSNFDSEPKEENMGVKSQFSNTFKGDRGGAAEDADLLAELRAISKNSSSNRFADTEALSDMPSQNPQGFVPEVAPKSTVAQPTPTVQNTQPISDLSAMNPFPTAPAAAVEINITLDGLDESLASSNWQIRKASYLFLQEKIQAVLSGREPENQLSGDDVYSSLDDAITKALGDKNAGALDSALTLSVTYSDCCKGACSEDTASQIMSLLLKGAAFASSRPSTLKTTQELVFKLVEVAPQGSSTADNVVDLIQQHGLKAKKPKVVKFAATLVLQLVQEFGTSVFNVSKLSAVHETLVANSNDKIRGVGIEVLAELCRTFGSKTPLQALVDKLKKSQQSQLDSLLDKQPTAKHPSRRLRCMRGVQIATQSPEEALAALKKNEEEEKLKRFASRPAVNLLQVLPQTCYSDKIKEVKWSEKVAALNALIEAGGEQPYKISDGNYTTLLRELKELLSHTHYLVCSKALAAIGMLAAGVGEPISSDLRPLLSTIVPLFKDKKVGKAVMSCLDQMFGNALRFDHFLGSNDSFLSSLDEKKEKNALVRKSVLEFLSRCVVSSGTYGTCGTLTSQHAQDLCKIACEKLKDSDATTRKAATDVLITLLNSKDKAIVSTAEKVTSSLQSSNPRAFKTLALATKSGKPDASRNGASRPGTAPLKATSSQPNKPGAMKARPTTAPKSKTANVPSAPAKNAPSSGTADEKFDESALPSLDESIDCLSGLGIPQWGDDADDGGVLTGIQSSNWKQRMGALNNLAAFYESNGDSEFSSIIFLFVLVKACTKSFQESNFNVAKAILELFKVLFNIHAERQTAPESFFYAPIVKLAAEKIGDRKLTASSSSCLDCICIVKDPHRVLHVATKAVDGVKSPLVHEALLVWIKTFIVNFGLSALSQGVKDVLVWILKECENNNMKVKNSARDVLGEMYTQLGPVLESFVKSSDVSSSVSSLVEKVFKDNAHDPNANQVERKLKCVTMSSSNGPKGGSGRGGNASSMLAVPTTDLMSALKSDCLDRMNDTGDKKSWRNRKEALDEVDAALGKCGGLLSTEGKAFVQLKQLAANLRLRINDSQSNLKPLAASVIGSLLSHLDDTAQAKLGPVVFPALVNAAMNDMKKTMRDAAVSALVLGTDSPKQNGGGTNAASVEAFILSLESELSDAAIKSSGLPDVLAFLTEKMESLIATNEQEKLSVHRNLAKVIVMSLLSSKSGSRSAAENLLAVCSKNGFVPSSSFDKEIGKLLPAQQRTVRSFIPKLSKQDQELVDTFKKASERPRRPGQMMPSRQTTQVGVPSNKTALQSPRAGGLPRKGGNNVSEAGVLPENPLQMSSTRSAKPKAQRLATLGKGDSWPEYSEEPSGDTLQALRKAWALFIPSTSIDVLFPQSGLRTHEDCMSGCDLLSKAIGYSRDNNDSSLLEMLDFIFKWAACAVLLRDHTSGFRKLLSTILDLFKRLDELSYVISDGEALLLLPYLLDKAGAAKLHFKEEILAIFTLVTTKKIYPSQKFGPVCMKVLEKSKSNPSRPLAAELCSIAVQSAGVSAIGKKGLVILSSALNEETVAEAKKVYIDLFEIVVEKLKGDTDKLFSAIKPTDKVKAIIMERCGNQPVATQGSPRRSPPRKTVPPVSHYSPTSGQEAPALSSSAVVTGNLRARLQKSKETKLSEESPRLPPSIDTTSGTKFPAPHSPRTPSTDTMYNEIMTDINFMTKSDECKASDIVRGTDAIQLLSTVISTKERSSLDPIQEGAFREKIESDYNTCMLTVASALNFAFDYGGKNAPLPTALINQTVAALSLLLRMQCCSSEMKQKTVEYLVNVTVSALLDERMHIDQNIMRATNKVAMRAVLSPSLDSSLNALISVQVSVIDPEEGNTTSEKFRSKFSRVVEKLLKKAIKDRIDSSPSNPFGELEELGSLLASIDWMVETIEDVARIGGGPEELLTPSTSMTRHLLLELVRCNHREVRETVEDLGNDVKFIEPLLRGCEQELGLQPPPPVVVPSSSGDSSFRQRLEALKRQRESNGN